MENWEMKNDRKIRLYKVSLISLEDLFFFEYLILKNQACKLKLKKKKSTLHCCGGGLGVDG